MLNKITFASVLLLLFFTALYYNTRTEVHTFDALSYTNDVETKPFGQLYHPHHLLYGPLGRLSFELAKNLGYEGRADQPIQFINALAGAFGVVMLWQVGRQFTGKNWQPLGAAVLVGMCYAYWLYAMEVEVYTLAALFIVLALWNLTRLDQQPSPPKVIFLALAAAGAVMFHQTNILFALPLGLFLLLDSRLRKYLPVLGIVFTAAVALPYLAVGWNSGFRDVNAFYDWLTGYAQTGQWGGNLNPDSVDALRAGLQNTVSPHNGTLAALFYLLAVVGLLLGFRSTKKTWLAFSAGWLILYGGFFWWWEPWNIEFWIVLLPLWALWMYFPSPLVGVEGRTVGAG
ncbi:MAG: glycosyltransferase family 39 protein, partial [Anaerolineae bacterium]|nr:glycosyltransferase family 39 protein [Anaerolineae bacterium]